jgi:hypothetical protein
MTATHIHPFGTGGPHLTSAPIGFLTASSLVARMNHTANRASRICPTPLGCQSTHAAQSIIICSVVDDAVAT